MASSSFGPGGSGPGPPNNSSNNAAAATVSKPKKKERWLVTRKTWRYMADAGKLLIPESLRKGKDMKEYTDDDLTKLEEHYQKVCDQQQDFIEWEGPRTDPRVLLVGNRANAPPAPAPDQPPHQEATGPKFRLVLPVGQQPPPGYVQVGKRTLPMGEMPLHDYDGPQQESSYVQLPSGLVLQELPAIYLTERDWYARRSSSPPDSGVLSPDEFSCGGDDPDHLDAGLVGHPRGGGAGAGAAESGIGSGADSVRAYGKRRHIGIQTDPLPEEFFRLVEEEKRREEEERRRKEEEERLAREQEERELEAMMGDSVMRYMKMVRRNSKSSDQKKAERFRSMNYDPTLRNIKAKYLNKEEYIEGLKKSMEVQVGESLLELLKKCQTPVEPPATLPSLARKFSNAASDLSDSLSSPQRRLSGVGGSADCGVGGHNIFGHAAEMALSGGGGASAHGGPKELERDFFAHLYSGDMTALESGTVPEDYYNYLESWYRAQKGLLGSPAASSGLARPNAAGQPHQSSSAMQPASIYIPVDALQNLRASMPILVTCAAAASTNSVSRSTNSIGKSPGQSFLSSVISLRPFAGSGGGSAPQQPAASASSSSGGHGARIMSKRLWRTRSKSQGRSSVSSSAWIPQGGARWQHLTNRCVMLESTHLLMLHEFERIALQKLALQKLNSSDLGITTRIPKDSSDKTKSRTYLLKKKVLPRWDTSRDKSRETVPGPVFGVPLGQCVDIPSANRKRSTCGGTSLFTGMNSENIPNPNDPSELLLSPVSKASRSDSRTSVGSSYNEKSQERIAGSTESLFFDFRRQSVGLLQSGALDPLCLDEVGELSVSGTFSTPCVPTVVMMCIRHLEQFGLHTVGIFRVSSSKKRVRQLREEFDRGGQITLSMETGVHDVATLLKEFFRDLPEPVIPREVQAALLATQKLKNIQEQIVHLQHIVQLLPLINRDTLYVLLQFLGLVAENAEDRTDESGSPLSGNRMDALNLATLFAPNLMHSFNDDPAKAGASMTSASERMDHVSALKLLIERRDLVFQVPSVELNDAYIYLNEHFPDVLDALLRRRSALAGIEIPEDFPVEEEATDDYIKRRPSKKASKDEESHENLELGSSVPSSSSRWSAGFRHRDQRGSDRRKPPAPAAGAGAMSSEPPQQPQEPSRSGGLRFSVPQRSFRKTSNTDSPSRTMTMTSNTREAIVYSPASSSFSVASVSSTRGTPCSDLFFGSGNTTPSHVTSPPPTQSHFGSPVPYSPPMSPPPLTTVSRDTPLVLSPVPRGVGGSRTPSVTPTPFNSYLSVSGQRIPMKSKTDDLERYIAEIEASEADSAAITPLASTQPRKYTRRRYTDSRHPTTELPDVTSASTGAINDSNLTLERPPLRRRPQQQLA